MNPRVSEISGSLIRQIAAKKKPSSLDLGLGEPTLLANPAHFDVALAFVREHGMRYTPNAGDPELRAAIAEHYAFPHMRSTENVCVTTGSQEAMYVTLKTLLDPARDELLVVEPAFPSYVKMARLENISVRTVAMDDAHDFMFDGERIAAAVGEKTRAIVICSPSNPTARVLAQDQAEILVRSLERRRDPVWLIHDEIYREQIFIGGAAHLAERYPNTIVTNSLSKSNALTGLRLGWAIAPPEITAALVKCHAWVTSCADTFAQRVGLSIFSNNGLREHADWYSRRHADVLVALQDSGLRYIRPEGSFYACVRLPDGMQSLEAANRLADECDVIAIPGIAFGASFEGWLRLSWMAPIEDLREGVARIATFCREQVVASP